MDFTNKVITIRTDFNVPIDNNLVITDYQRIDKTIPTIKEVISKNPKLIILISHLGRPKITDKNELSLEPVRVYLSLVLKRKIQLVRDYFPNIHLNQYSGIILLENIRYIDQEENYKPNNLLSEYLTLNTDVYINEAFSCSHRSHTSIVGINPKIRLAGKLLINEIAHLAPVISNKNKKTLIIGGSKISDKIKLIENLLPSLDNLIIGGAMAFSFLKVVKNLEIGKTIYDSKSDIIIERIYKLIEDNKYSVNVILPIDWVVSENINSTDTYLINSNIPKNLMGLDIGSESIFLFNKILNTLPKETIIVWNGPMGVFEKESFSYGTESIAKTLVNNTNNKVIIGGGDSAAAFQKFTLKDERNVFLERENHISTGGGACLEFLEGKNLPGLTNLVNL